MKPFHLADYLSLACASKLLPLSPGYDRAAALCKMLTAPHASPIEPPDQNETLSAFNQLDLLFSVSVYLRT